MVVLSGAVVRRGEEDAEGEGGEGGGGGGVEAGGGVSESGAGAGCACEWTPQPASASQFRIAPGSHPRRWNRRRGSVVCSGARGRGRTM